MTDTERLDKIEAAARQSIVYMFGADARCGFIVSSAGDVLSGTIEAYPYATLREAVDALESCGEILWRRYRETEAGAWHRPLARELRSAAGGAADPLRHR